MFSVHELSQAVRTRRLDVGWSQATLARMSGLSRTTINQVERGTIKDLSISRINTLLTSLGLSLTISPAHPRVRKHEGPSSALELAARTASTSYARCLPADVLAMAVRTGEAPPKYVSHIATLLDEVSLPLLARVVEQVYAESAVPRTTCWSNLRRLARQLMTTRYFWQA
ncbi:helix-turn-helix transcriptional regulator [Variovorax sp. HJSM1_2]|uniref:helix-turn-helix transcriptional regulator n=1 Tax=Variovorax sp. HJSM1_2 TaxID=3366263 RepID=UPI003BD95A1A